MMKNIFLAVIISFLLLSPVFQAAAQSNTGTSSGFDTTDFPQWAKDLRRWDIILFGSFPFAMFTATFFHDMYRWNNANGMDFSEAGRRYAPWPLKSAGAVEMTKEEYERTIWAAVGLSVAVAVTDLIIHKAKQNRERRRIDSMPTGTIIYERRINQELDDIPEDAE
jgi:hypothetical protein